MEENNINSNPVNEGITPQPVPTTEPVTEQTIQEPVQFEQPATTLEAVTEQTIQEPVQPAIEEQPIDDNIDITSVSSVEPQIPVENINPQPTKKSGGNRGLVAIVVLVLLILIILGILFGIGKLGFGKKPTNNTPETTKVELKSKTINNVNLDKNSSIKYNDITVAVIQTEANTGTGYNTTSIKVNGTEIIDKVNIGSIKTYSVFNDYVVFLSYNTSGTLLSIYNPENGTVMKYEPMILSGYAIKSYIIDNDTIVATGTNQALQYGKKDPGYKNAEIKITYTEGTFAAPRIVRKYNDSSVGELEETSTSAIKAKTASYLNGSSTMTYDDVTVAIIQTNNQVGLSATSVKVNGVEIADKVNIGGISEYTIFDNFVIFLSYNTSGSKLSIYNTKDSSVKEYDPSKLSGYSVNRYYIKSNKIVLICSNHAQQAGMTDPGYSNAEIELTYKRGSIGEAEIISQYNEKLISKVEHNVVGASQTTFNNVNVNIQQTAETSASVCKLSSLKVNNKEVKDKISNLCVNSYAIVNEYVLFLTYDTSHTEFVIYDSKTDSIVKKYTATDLKGYMVKDYSVLDNKIFFTGRNVGEQFGIKTENYDYIDYEIQYANNSFLEPTEVLKY